MPHDFADICDAGRAQRMSLGKQAARHVNRSLAAEPRMHPAAFVDELARLAVAAKTEVLVMHQFGSSETVMQFGQRDVLRPDTCGFVGLFRGAARQRAY